MEERLTNPEEHQAKLKRNRDCQNSMMEEFKQEEPEAWEMYQEDRLQTRRDYDNNRRQGENYNIDKVREQRNKGYRVLKSNPDKLRKRLDRINLMRRLKKSDPVKHAELLEQSKLDRRKPRK